MGLFMKTHIRLLVLVCVGVTSCGPTHTQTGSERSKTRDWERQMDMERGMLSREQIIEAANAVAREYGWDPEEAVITWDEGNTRWRHVFSMVHMPELEGHDYQAVIYAPRRLGPSAELWVAVDRNTGEVVRVVGPGRKPRK